MTALAMLWPSAVTVAALGTWLLFDASLGVNWPIWTLVASASLALCAAIAERRVPLAILPPLLLGCALAAGAPLTANRAFAALIVSGGLCLLAAAMLLARNPATGWLNLPFVAGLPVIAPLFALIEAARRSLELLGALASARWRAAVRGGAMAFPVITAMR